MPTAGEGNLSGRFRLRLVKGAVGDGEGCPDGPAHGSGRPVRRIMPGPVEPGARPRDRIRPSGREDRLPPAEGHPPQQAVPQDELMEQRRQRMDDGERDQGVGGEFVNFADRA